MIISITGKIGSGKDTIADIIMQYTPYHDWEIKKFAGKLKVIAEILSGVPKINFEDQEFKKQDMGPAWGMTYRDLLQKLGTEAMRNGLHENVWVNALFSDYNREWVSIGDNTASEDAFLDKIYPNWIITDTRFPNELEAAKALNGITIKVIRDSGNTIGTTHASETALDDYTEWDYIVDNNGSFEELKTQVFSILEKESLLKYAGL
jgi:hypothetical protein